MPMTNCVAIMVKNVSYHHPNEISIVTMVHHKSTLNNYKFYILQSKNLIKASNITHHEYSISRTSEASASELQENPVINIMLT